MWCDKILSERVSLFDHSAKSWSIIYKREWRVQGPCTPLMMASNDPLEMSMNNIGTFCALAGLIAWNYFQSKYTTKNTNSSQWFNSNSIIDSCTDSLGRLHQYLDIGKLESWKDLEEKSFEIYFDSKSQKSGRIKFSFHNERKNFDELLKTLSLFLMHSQWPDDRPTILKWNLYMCISPNSGRVFFAATNDKFQAVED